MRNQKGFTLIELIIVIVVLGILAVTAAPQFINFSSDARASTVKGLKGALQGASQTIYARAAIDGSLDGTSAAPVQVNGVDTVFGYPAASATGIIVAAQLEAQLATDSDITSEWIYTINTAEATDRILIAPADVGDGTSIVLGDGCYAMYQETADANTAPNVTVKVENCD